MLLQSPQLVQRPEGMARGTMPPVASVIMHHPVKFSCNVFIVICYFGRVAGTGESSHPPCQVFQFKVCATMPGQTILSLLLLLLMVLTYKLLLFPLFWFSTFICLCVHSGQWHTGEAQASSSIMWNFGD